jgi:uncharacterized protein (TIRG00374 family)
LKKYFKSIIKFILFTALGILLIYLSIKNLSAAQRMEIFVSFRQANYFWIFLAILCGALSHFIRAVRWRRLLAPMGYSPKTKDMFLATLIGYFANYAIPRLGEISRCSVLYKTDKIPLNKSRGTGVTERVFDLLIFVIIFFVTVFLEKERIGSYLDTNIYPQFNEKLGFLGNQYFIFFVIAFFVLLIGLYLIFRKKIKKTKFFISVKNLFDGFLLGIRSLFKIKKAWLFILESVSIWVLYFFMTYLCFFSMQETSSLSANAGLATLVIGSFGIMVTPGGLGLYPILAQETLKLYGIGKITGLAMGWIIWTSQTVMILAFGSVALIIISLHTKKQKLNAEPTT